MKKGEKASLPDSAKKCCDPSARPHSGSFAEAADKLGGVKPLDRAKGPVAGPRPIVGSERKDIASPDRPSMHRPKAGLPRDASHLGKSRTVSNRDLRKLRAGRMRPEVTVDLHGFTRDAAHSRLCSAVTRARRSGCVCILVIHGKGYRSPGGEAVLKPALALWIEEPPLVDQVAACCPAQARDGGGGASYLLLRASGPGR